MQVRIAKCGCGVLCTESHRWHHSKGTVLRCSSFPRGSSGLQVQSGGADPRDAEEAAVAGTGPRPLGLRAAGCFAVCLLSCLSTILSLSARLSAENKIRYNPGAKSYRRHQ